MITIYTVHPRYKTSDRTQRPFEDLRRLHFRIVKYLLNVDHRTLHTPHRTLHIYLKLEFHVITTLAGRAHLY